jgi:hypothetical protein
MLKGDFSAGRGDDPWQCIPTAWVEAAVERWRNRQRPGTPQSALGVDPSRGGADELVIAARYDNWIDELTVIPGAQVPTGQDALTVVYSAWRNGAAIGVDSIGVGASLFDIMKGNGINATALIGSQASHARDRSGQLGFANKRAEWWWMAREALDPENHEEIALPPDPKLKADLCAPRWKATTRSGIQVESKEDLMRRLGRSPDRGDAVVYALNTFEPARMKANRERPHESCAEYDPLSVW